ncbi:MAG: hypothetical protein K6U04_02760 [Armatimonadetes bacterium]|nr:hypothetical protein [Armatimonadota bacterium]
MNKIAVIYSGSKWQSDLFHSEKYRPFFDFIIHACDLPKKDFSIFDVLVIPRESNQEMLFAVKDKINRFLESGGLVISFGEVTRPWLPGCVWEQKDPRFKFCETGQNPRNCSGRCVWEKGKLDGRPYKLLKPEHPLFKGLEIEDLQWHFHGIFHAPGGAEVLLKYGEEADLVYLDGVTCPPGVILATTLDPDVHAGYGVVKKTQKFLDNVFHWARNRVRGHR